MLEAGRPWMTDRGSRRSWFVVSRVAGTGRATRPEMNSLKRPLVSSESTTTEGQEPERQKQFRLGKSRCGPASRGVGGGVRGVCGVVPRPRACVGPFRISERRVATTATSIFVASIFQLVLRYTLNIFSTFKPTAVFGSSRASVSPVHRLHPAVSLSFATWSRALMRRGQKRTGAARPPAPGNAPRLLRGSFYQCVLRFLSTVLLRSFPRPGR